MIFLDGSYLFGIEGATWSSDWAWGLPLIVLTVVIHALGLGLIGRQAIDASSGVGQHRYPVTRFVIVVATTTLLATCLHGIEAIIWAKAFRLLGAAPDLKSAILYSLNAITSYGHTTLTLDAKWQLMGSLEALNGWLLFGLTAAFLFSIVQKVWSLGRGGEPQLLMRHADRDDSSARSPGLGVAGSHSLSRRGSEPD